MKKMSDNLNANIFSVSKQVRTGKTLVLAAHPDDEVLGCGGAMALHVRQGDPLFIVICTDGGLPVNPDQDFSGYHLVRKRESVEAAALLGCNTPVFLDFPDGELKKVPDLKQRILQLFMEYQPDIIYLPASTEIHPDHLALCIAGTEAAKKYTGTFTLFFYEIGAPGYPTFYLDITEVSELKQQAIGCFLSQLKVQNLTEQISGLNQYRTYYLPKEVKSTEAFFTIAKNEIHTLGFEHLQSERVNRIFSGVNGSKQNFPLISVIIRTMNRVQLPEALDSVARQTYPEIEVILVDATGTMSLNDISVPEHLNLRLITDHRLLTRPEAANAGLNQIRGDYFCFLDEDDLIDPDHLADLWKWLHYRDEHFIYSGIRMVDESGNEIKVYNEPFNHEHLQCANYIPIHAVLYKRDVLDAGCRFDETLLLYEDWDFLLSVAEFSKPFHLEKISGTYRNFRSSEIYSETGESRKFNQQVLDKWQKFRQQYALNNPLVSYFYSNRKNIIHKWPHYFEIYHQYFQRFINSECVVVEIGVALGGSLRMWKSYFGVKARIIGIDINPECKKFEEPGIEILVGSQADRDFLKNSLSRIPKIDIVIDDGGHTMEQQITSFKMLFPHMSSDGIYLCEDTHTSYLKEFGGGLKQPGTFIEYAKTLADHLHAWHVPDGLFPASEYTRNIRSIHFYDSVVVIEKHPRVQPWSEIRGEGIPFGQEPVTPLATEIFRMKLNLLGANLPEHMNVGPLISHPLHLQEYLGERFEGTIWPDKGETMIGWKRLTNLEYCVKQVLDQNIPGDFIETGVWKGGACIFMAYLLKINNITDRIVWIADSFCGLPEPDPVRFPHDSDSDHHTHSVLAVPEEVVKSNFQRYNIPESQIRFLKGWFKDTLHAAPVDKLAILRLDGDMYESTIEALNALYPKLAPGGYCIIDDYGAIEACRMAVEDFRRANDISEEIAVIDYTGVYWKKVRS